MSAIRKISPQTATAPSTSSAKTAKTMSIGVVLERLRQEFPDVTVSKIRFLESEGLITPQRTASGYRRFTEQDVERLRYILVTQRDNYLPLKVIREQLEAMDAGQVSAVLTAVETEPVVSPETFRAVASTRLTDREVAAQAGVSEDVLNELIQHGLISPDAAGLFTGEDVRIISTVVALREFGFDSRHFKAIRTAAARQADLIAQVTSPVAKSGKPAARHNANEMGQRISALLVALHASLINNDIRDQLAR